MNQKNSDGLEDIVITPVDYQFLEVYQEYNKANGIHIVPEDDPIFLPISEIDNSFYEYYKAINKKREKCKKRKKKHGKKELTKADDSRQCLFPSFVQQPESDDSATGYPKTRNDSPGTVNNSCNIRNTSFETKGLSIYQAAKRLWESDLVSIVDGKLYLRIDGVDVPANSENLSSTMLRIMSQEECMKIGRSSYFSDVGTMLKALKIEYGDLSYNTTELYQTPIIKFSNGIFDVSSGHQYYIGEYYYHCFYKLDAAFIPMADLETPVMDRVIVDATAGDEECIQLFWAVLGMLLLPDIRAKKMYVFGTARHSGKTQILDFLNAIYGEYSSTCNLNKLGESYETASIVGKYLCYDGDLSNEALQEKAVGVIKKITGGDVTKTRQIFCSHEDNKLLSKLVVATNHPIKLKRPDEAFWDRVVIVPFICTKAENDRDANLLIKLLDERDAIVTKAILCGLKVIENHYQFPHCAVSEGMLADWAEGPNSSVEEFLEDLCILSKDKFAQNGETTKNLYLAYSCFCRDNGYKVLNENNFAKYLSNQKGLVRKRFPEGRGFLGIELVDSRFEGYL